MRADDYIVFETKIIRCPVVHIYGRIDCCQLNRRIQKALVQILYFAQNIINHVPPLISHTGLAPKDVRRINGSLDLQKSRIVITPECVLEVGLVWEGLRHILEYSPTAGVRNGIIPR